MGIDYTHSGFDPDHPLSSEEAQIVADASAAFEKANDLKMETVSLDPGEAKPVFEKARHFHQMRLRVHPSGRPLVTCHFRTINVAVFEGKK